MSESCAFSGNSDLYGLGIRLGIYLQWASALLAVMLGKPNLINQVWDAYIVFSFAITVALFTLSFTYQMRVVEVVLMLYLCFSGLMSILYCTAFQRPIDRRTWRQTALSLAWMINSGYSAWFWLSGRSSKWFLQDGCHTYLFLFAKIGPNRFNSVCKLLAAMSIYPGVLLGVILVPWPTKLPEQTRRVYSAMQLVDGIEAVKQLGQSLSLNNTTIDELSSAVQDELFIRNQARENRISTLSVLERDFRHTREPRKSYPSLSYAERLLLDEYDLMEDSYLLRLAVFQANTCVFIYSVLSIELMLHWNHVSGVYTLKTVGQLIPFVIGLMGFLKLLIDVWHDFKLSQRLLHDEKPIQRHSQKANQSFAPAYPFFDIAGSRPSM